MDGEEVRYLLVEDDDDHAEFLERTLKRCRRTNQVTRLCDGAEAVAYLTAPEAQPDRALPHLILLDLKLPKLDGHEVLERIKSEPSLSGVPVVVLSTSDTDSDRRKAYERHANGYLVKPTDFESFREMIQALDHYWGRWNRSAAHNG